MIPKNTIYAWKDFVPWSNVLLVEQDLLICRCLVAIFSDNFLSQELAFRGGTALHKLYFHPQPRYSEDIDLVQIHPGPIKPILQRLGEVLDFMPEKVTKQKHFNNSLLFRMNSEIPPIAQIRLKIEINCCEHFTQMGYVKIPFSVSTPWFSGDCLVNTYHLEELIATKLRALYQRRKGRDLFDLYYALSHAHLDVGALLECYQRYIAFTTEQPPSYRVFLTNLDTKMQDRDFLGDTELLLRPEISYSPQDAQELLHAKVLTLLPGKHSPGP